MIQVQTSVHDRFSVEFKINFADKEQQHQLFKMNSWIFVPDSLNINGSTYSKEQFYRDVKSNIRLKTPQFTLQQLADAEAPTVRYLNAARIGDDFATGLGLNVKLARRCVLLGASILAGASTAFCGPVAFIGIAVPHLAYMLFGTTNHRVLIPGCLCCGSLFALVAGLFPVSIPLNAILSVVGVPVILYVILRGPKGRGA